MSVCLGDVELYNISSFYDIKELILNKDAAEPKKCRAAVFIISKNRKEHLFSNQQKIEILEYLAKSEMILCLVVDFSLKSEDIDFILAFDFVLATERGEIDATTVNTESYFSEDSIKFFLGKEAGEKAEFSEVLINQWINSTNIEEEVEFFLKPILQNKDLEYIQMIKRYFNHYKNDSSVELLNLQKSEIALFSKLAISVDKR